MVGATTNQQTPCEKHSPTFREGLRCSIREGVHSRALRRSKPRWCWPVGWVARGDQGRHQPRRRAKGTVRPISFWGLAYNSERTFQNCWTPRGPQAGDRTTSRTSPVIVFSDRSLPQQGFKNSPLGDAQALHPFVLGPVVQQAP